MIENYSKNNERGAFFQFVKGENFSSGNPLLPV
jgi:hypothetical protein